MVTDLYYKAVRLDMTSHYDKRTRWEVGKPVRVANPSPVEVGVCGRGLHVSQNLLDAVGYQSGPSEYLRVEVQPQHVILGDDTKTRISECLPVGVLTAEEQNRLTGFRLHEANHPVNPLLVKGPGLPEDELRVLLADWDSVRYSVQNSVRDSVRNSVWNSVWNFVWYSVWDSVRYSVRDSVRDSVPDSAWDSVGQFVMGYIGSLFPGVTVWEGTDRTNPWASLHTLWLAGYLPSFDGSIWRLHRGPDAEVIPWKGKQ